MSLSNNKNYFFCYNKSVADFMKTKKVYFITVAMDVKSQKVFSLFEITPEFRLAMDEYKTSKE